MSNTLTMVLIFTAAASFMVEVVAIKNVQDVTCPPLAVEGYTENYRPYSTNFSHICVTVGFPSHIEYFKPYPYWLAKTRCALSSGEDITPGFLLEAKDALWLLQNTDLAKNRTNADYWIHDQGTREAGWCAFLHLDAFGNITQNSTSCNSDIDNFLCYTLAYNAPCFKNGTTREDCYYNGKNPITGTSYQCFSTYCRDGRMIKPSDLLAPPATTLSTKTTSAAPVHASFQYIGQFLFLALYLMH